MKTISYGDTTGQEQYMLSLAVKIVWCVVALEILVIVYLTTIGMPEWFIERTLRPPFMQTCVMGRLWDDHQIRACDATWHRLRELQTTGWKVP